MLARFVVALPFYIVMPESEQYDLPTYKLGDLEITYGLPVRTERLLSTSLPEHMELDGRPAFVADAIQITFKRSSFDRKVDGVIDPDFELVSDALHRFLDRLKYVARAPQIKPIDLTSSVWRLRYLNDDGSELSQQAGEVRGRGATSFSFSFVPLHRQMWDAVHALPLEFDPPSWHTLLVDSRGALPHVGSAVVLAAAALEVFIADVLERLAPKTDPASALWKWANDRGDWRKEPSVEDQYSELLAILCGRSLKEDNVLWEAFKNLRTTRNNFVHHGRAELGGRTLSPEGARVLIDRADQIVARVRDWLPESLRWPVFSTSAKFSIRKVMLRVRDDDNETDQSGKAA